MVAHKKFLNDHNMQVDISYLNISFGMLNRNSMKNEILYFIILLAKNYIYTSKYKQQKTIYEGFKKILKQRLEKNITMPCLKINLIIIIKNGVS